MLFHAENRVTKSCFRFARYAVCQQKIWNTQLYIWSHWKRPLEQHDVMTQQKLLSWMRLRDIFPLHFSGLRACVRGQTKRRIKDFRARNWQACNGLWLSNTLSRSLSFPLSCVLDCFDRREKMKVSENNWVGEKNWGISYCSQILFAWPTTN